MVAITDISGLRFIRLFNLNPKCHPVPIAIFERGSTVSTVV